MSFKSSVRPIISLAFTFAVIIGFFKGLVSGDIVAGILGPITGFWFGERSLKSSDKD